MLRITGLPTIPVYVHPAEGDEATLRTHRVIEQMVLNDHRAKLTEAERARGINLRGRATCRQATSRNRRAGAVTARAVARNWTGGRTSAGS
ncbi:MAG: hypothetical protein JST91_31325 [Actinobacteria bacterium]|nr:hypothetical protein [Actinomycetota bacterium]